MEMLYKYLGLSQKEIALLLNQKHRFQNLEKIVNTNQPQAQKNEFVKGLMGVLTSVKKYTTKLH
jgi:hypothetical protein